MASWSHSVRRLLGVLAVISLAAGCTSSDETATSTTAAETTVTTQESTTIEPTETTEQSTSTTTEAASESGRSECPAGERETGLITGVFEFANLRNAPTTSAELIAELPANSEATYVVDSFERGDDRLWIAIEDGETTCGWMAAEYLKDSSGKLLGFITGEEYVRRALLGLDAESAHGTFTQDGAEAPKVPLDDTELRAAVAALRKIGEDNPEATVRPDATIEVDPGAPDGVGCIFVDGLTCWVEVVGADDELITVVSIGWYGDGITGIELTSDA